MKIFVLIILIVLSGCDAQKNPINEKRNLLENSFFKEAKITEREIVLGEAVTNIIDRGASRLNNIEVACEKINGTEVKKGEVFSFNFSTGKRSTENGYKKAPVIVDGEKSEGIGGGVCQVSTTIYLAAMEANISVVEHHNHSERVAYAPRGKDATVVYGIKDLKIKNNTSKSIYIYTWIDDKKVFSKIVQKSIDIQ